MVKGYRVSKGIFFSQQDKVTGAVSVKDVQFSYPARPDVQVLQGVSLSLSPGKTLALVGPSGCGKSTVVSLIERFYDPSVGSLALENFDLRDLNLHWLRSQIGIVSQEPVLFDASIAENIRYGALFREVSDEEVIEAAKSANIHSFIESLPQVMNELWVFIFTNYNYVHCNDDVVLVHAGLQHQCWSKGHSAERRTEAEDSHRSSTDPRPQDPPP